MISAYLFKHFNFINVYGIFSNFIYHKCLCSKISKHLKIMHKCFLKYASKHTNSLLNKIYGINSYLISSYKISS